jgi:SHAQKYF class myb-like DNA-binding protein
VERQKKSKGNTKGIKRSQQVVQSKVPVESGTGRWTNEEHILFLKGLEQYGKGWKKIAKLIKTRTVVQIRTHAQKYFQKLNKAKRCGNGDLYLDGRSCIGRKGRFGRRRTSFYGSFINVKRDVVDPNTTLTSFTAEKVQTKEGKSHLGNSKSATTTLEGKTSLDGSKSPLSAGKFPTEGSFQANMAIDSSTVPSDNGHENREASISSYLKPLVKNYDEEGVESALFSFLTPATTDMNLEDPTTRTDPLLELEKEEYNPATKQYNYKLRNHELQQSIPGTTEDPNLFPNSKLLGQKEHQIRMYMKNMEKIGLTGHHMYSFFTQELQKCKDESKAKNSNQTQNNQGQTGNNVNFYDNEDSVGTSMHGYYPTKIPIEIYSRCRVPLWYNKAADIDSLLSSAKDLNWGMESNNNNFKLN